MSATKNRRTRLSVSQLDDRIMPAARVVGYYPEWATWGNAQEAGRQYQPADIPASKLTHVVYSFAKIVDNKIAIFDPQAALLKDFGPAGPDPYDGLFGQFKLMKQNNPGLKTSIAVGGWTLSDPFPTMADTAETRKTFNDSCVAFIRQYGFDGVDLDWEYPVSGGLYNNPNVVPPRPQDKHNFTLLCQELRATLNAAGVQDGKTYTLSAAIGASYGVTPNYELSAVAQSLDWVSAMTYDYHGGSFETRTNHNAPLKANPADVSPESDQRHNQEWAINEFLNQGVPADKLQLGLAIYGRSWAHVAPGANHGLYMNSTGVRNWAAPAQDTIAGPGTWERGVFDYKDLYNKVNTPGSGYTRYWDDVAKVPYAYNPSVEGGVFASYDDAQSTRLKLDFAHQKGLGGVLFWEISADLPVTNPNSLIRIASEAVLTPEVQSIKVNDGASAQRSMVKSLQVTFDSQVTFVGAPASAFTLSRVGGGGTVTFTATTAVVNGQTVVTLGSFTGTGTENGSLKDGRYSVSVASNKVQTAFGFLDGNGDGTAGDNYVLVGDTTNKLFRLFGDANGDGVTNGADLSLFTTAFGSPNTTFDFNGDGVVNGAELTEFVKRFGVGVQ